MRQIATMITALLLLSGLTHPIHAANVTTDYPFLITCNGQFQMCQPPFTVNVTTQAVLTAQYFVHPGHCSSIRVHLFLNGSPTDTSTWLGYAGDPQNRPLQTPIYDLGPVPSGTYQVDLQGEGLTGAGCNPGWVAGWGGTLRIITSEDDPVPVESTTWTGVKARHR